MTQMRQNITAGCMMYNLNGNSLLWHPSVILEQISPKTPRNSGHFILQLTSHACPDSLRSLQASITVVHMSRNGPRPLPSTHSEFLSQSPLIYFIQSSAAFINAGLPPENRE
jgi:hypothetical protein